MKCSIQDLCEKDVINVKTGCRLGPVCDVEVDTECGKLVALIIYGKNRLMGLGGREGDIKVCWDDICVIGDDTILVKADHIEAPSPRDRHKAWEGLFR